MRPRWLQGWTWSLQVRGDPVVPGDRRPLAQRLMLLIGLRRDF